MTNQMLDARQLKLSIAGKALLKGIDIQVQAGEHLVILGANGAGKSTLLKALCGEITYDSGEIHVNGQALKQLPLKQLARMRAVMPQETQLNFPFRAIEVVEMGAAPYPASSEEPTITQQCLQAFDLTHLAQQRYPSLSGGEKQRVQLARVFCQLWPRQGCEKARYLFLDECSSALDPAHQYQVFERVQALRAQNVGIVSIVHDLNLAAGFADRIVILHQGEVLAEGSPKHVLTPANLKAAYGIETQVLKHPVHAHPLVVSLGRC